MLLPVQLHQISAVLSILPTATVRPIPTRDRTVERVHDLHIRARVLPLQDQALTRRKKKYIYSHTTKIFEIILYN